MCESLKKKDNNNKIVIKPRTNARLVIAIAVLVENAHFADGIANCVPSGVVPLFAAKLYAVRVEPAAPALKAEALVGPVGHPTGRTGRLGHHGRANRLDGSAAIDSTLDDPATFRPAAETLSLDLSLNANRRPQYLRCRPRLALACCRGKTVVCRLPSAWQAVQRCSLTRRLTC